MISRERSRADARHRGFAFLAMALQLSFVVTAIAEDRALLIGITRYADRRIPKLPGCDDDAREVSAMLRQGAGMRPEQIKLLLSADATHGAIVAALDEWLVAGTQPGDRVVLYYSGHGSQVKDQNGDERDGMDEVLCPHDYDPRTQANLLRDDDLDEYLSKLEGRNVTIIVDSCHSGTAFKTIGSQTVSDPLYPTTNVIAKFIAPPAEGESGIQTRGAEPSDAGSMQDEQARNQVFYSACQDGQRAEIGAFVESGHVVWRSVFTRAFLTGAAGRADANGDGQTTNAEMRSYLSSSLHRFTQTPHIACEPLYEQQLIFGRTLSLNGSARVFYVKDHEAAVNRGRYHGTKEGDRFTLRSGDGEKPNENVIEVDRVESFVSFGHAAKDIEFQPPGPEIEPLTSIRPMRQLHVFFGDFTGVGGGRTGLPETLRDAVAAEPELAIEPDQAACDRIVSGSVAADGTMSVFIYGRFGRLQSQFTSDAEGAVAQLVRRLKGQLLLEKLAVLDQPSNAFNLRLQIEGGQSDYLIYPKGDPRRQSVRFRIQSERACHLVLLSVDSQGEITLLWPNRWHLGSRLEPGKTYTVPDDGADFIFPVRVPPGQDAIKAVATVKPIDLRGVNAKGLREQGFVRFAPGQETTIFEDVLARGIGVESAAESRPQNDQEAFVTDVPQADWATATMTIQTYLPQTRPASD